MSVAEQPVSSAAPDDLDAGPSRRFVPSGWAGIALLFVVAAAVYSVFALLWPVPVIYPDENFYGGLARSIANGDGMSWRGEHIDQPSALYMYAISPAWVLASGQTAYLLAKVMGAVVMCTTAIPIWLILRRVAPQWLALAAGALSVMGTWMVQAGALTTETFSLPFATASLCAAVATIRKPGSRYIWLALIFGLLATATRFQCVTILVAVWASLLLDVVLAGRGWWRRARQHAWPIAVFTALLGVAGVVYLTDPGTLVGSGSYYGDLTGVHADPVETLRRGADHVAVLAVSAGMLPLSLLLGLLVRRTAWRDEALRPMLLVALPVAAGLCLQAGYYFAGYEKVYGGAIYWTSHRYIAYASPFILATVVLAAYRPRVLNWFALAVAAASLPVLLLLPVPGVLYDERPLFALQDSVGRVLPNASADHMALALAGAMAAVWAILWVVGRGRLREARTVSLVAVLVLGLGWQSAEAWDRAQDTADRFRSASPADLQWIDHHSSGPVAVLISGIVGGELGDMELLNDQVDQVYVFQQPSGSRLDGRTCNWGVNPDGRMVFTEPCAKGATPRELWIEDPMIRMAFYDERRSAADQHIGRLVAVGSAPRLKAMVRTPCERLDRPMIWNATMERPPRQCLDNIDLRTWTDGPAKLRLRFQGAPVENHSLSVARDDPSAQDGSGLGKVRDQAIPAARYTDVTVPVPRGSFHRVIKYDWGQPGDLTPHLLSIELVQDGKRQSLL